MNGLERNSASVCLYIARPVNCMYNLGCTMAKVGLVGAALCISIYTGTVAMLTLEQMPRDKLDTTINGSLIFLGTCSLNIFIWGTVSKLLGPKSQ